MPDQSDNILKYLDIENALDRVRGNKPLFRRMLGMFLEANEFSELETHLQNEDYAEAGKSAHSIKGVSGNLSLTALFEWSSELTDELRKGAPSERTLTQYHDALEQTKLAVKKMLTQLDAE